MMPIGKTEVVVVGAGQAGLAISDHLTKAGVPHLVLERNRIAERWRSERWDSLVANGPSWHDRYPGLEFPGFGPDDFVPKEAIADSFAEFAARNKLPVRTGVDVKSVRKNTGSRGFTVETSAGTIAANFVVAATGPFQKPVFPAIVPEDAGIEQMHSTAYRNPSQLPAGAVLVVGGGSSGVQIAEELLNAGRRVYLSVGPHDRPPRRYRGRDNVWWLGVLGLWDALTPPEGREHVTIAVSGMDGGKTVDFRKLAARGMVLVGRTESYANGRIRFASDVKHNVEQGDANYLSVLRAADEFIARNGLDLPEEKEAHVIGPDPECLTNPILDLDLKQAGVSSIIWATGFTTDFSWLPPGALDPKGKPSHLRGVSTEPGIYFLGLPWLSRRGSTFIWGVWHDAKFIADQIAIQRGYMAYSPDKT